MRYILSGEVATSTLDDNVKATAELQDILSDNRDVKKVKGVYKGVAETSFIIPAIAGSWTYNAVSILAIAKSFEQESILELNDDTGTATLIFTLNGGRLELGQHVIVTELPAGTEAYTEVSDGIFLIVK